MVDVDEKLFFSWSFLVVLYAFLCAPRNGFREIVLYIFFIFSLVLNLCELRVFAGFGFLIIFCIIFEYRYQLKWVSSTGF
jgi:hypothetical protein